MHVCWATYLLNKPTRACRSTAVLGSFLSRAARRVSPAARRVSPAARPRRRGTKEQGGRAKLETYISILSGVHVGSLRVYALCERESEYD